MKTEFNIKDQVWLHLGEQKLTEGRVVEIIDLYHLNEGYDPDQELYVIEIQTGIEPIYEVRTLEQLSPDANGPLILYRTLNKDVVAANRLFKKVGVSLPENAVTTSTIEEPAPAKKKFKRRYYKSKR
jgi:hypothetical protein